MKALLHYVIVILLKVGKKINFFYGTQEVKVD